MNYRKISTGNIFPRSDIPDEITIYVSEPDSKTGNIATKAVTGSSSNEKMLQAWMFVRGYLPDRTISKMATITIKGGKGSGHRGHRGRPGKRGGSLPDDAPPPAEYFLSAEEPDYNQRKALQENYPKLASTLGNNLILEADINDPTVAMHLKDLDTLPEDVLNFAKNNNVEIRLSNTSITSMDSNQYLKGVVPRGWYVGTWDDVSGISRGNLVCAGAGRGSSDSIVLHELGHTLFNHTLRARNITVYKNFIEIYKRIPASRLNPYFRQPNQVGLRELLAESWGMKYGRYGSRGLLADNTSYEWADAFIEYAENIK